MALYKYPFINILSCVGILLLSGCAESGQQSLPLPDASASDTSVEKSNPSTIQKGSWIHNATLTSEQTKRHTALIYCPDNTHLITSNQEGHIEVWNVATNKVIRSWITPEPITLFTFSPDGTQLAGASRGQEDNVIFVWEWPTGTLLHELHDHQTSRCQEFLCFNGKDCCCVINCLSYTTNGQELIAASSKNGALYFWNPKSGALLRTLNIDMSAPLAYNDEKSDGQFEAIAISPTGKYIASTENLTFYPTERYPECDPDRSYNFMYETIVKIWDANTGNLVKEIPTGIIDYCHSELSNEIAFSSNGNYLAVANPSATLCLISTENWSVIKLDNSQAGRNCSIRDRHTLCFSPNCDYIIATVGKAFSYKKPDEKCAAIMWDICSGTILQTFNLGYQIALSPNGKMLAISMRPIKKRSIEPAAIWLFNCKYE